MTTQDFAFHGEHDFHLGERLANLELCRVSNGEAETDEAPRSQPPPPEVEADLEIDEDFLRRIREV